MGAFSVTSNLKNTYGTVKMNIEKEIADSERVKLGSFFADSSKVSISTAINAGKKIGVASHISSVVTQDVPSFTFWSTSPEKQLIEIDVDHAIKTLERMSSRRDVKMSKAYRDILRSIFHLTEKERRRAGIKKGRIGSQHRYET
jgi:hypothetical protein